MAVEKKIFKYEIPVTDEFELELPKGAKILTFQTQNNTPYIWAIVDSNVEVKEKVSFRLFGTGHLLDLVKSMVYIGTTQMFDGGLVWHLFQKKGGEK